MRALHSLTHTSAVTTRSNRRFLFSFSHDLSPSIRVTQDPLCNKDEIKRSLFLAIMETLFSIAVQLVLCYMQEQTLAPVVMRGFL